MKTTCFVRSSLAVLALVAAELAAFAADPPFIIQQPQPQTVPVGGTAVFQVEVTGTPPFGFRWRRSGATVQTGPSSTLVISNVQPFHAGLYSVVITNEANPVPGILSSNALLTVLTNGGPPPPGNLVSISNVWRYDQNGIDLLDGWRDPNFDDSAWPSGLAALGFETSPLPVPINTQLNIGPTTYYFRTKFSLSPSQLNTQSIFRAYTLIDDGAVVYVNGAEVLRLRLPPGPITADTFAAAPPGGDATLEGPFAIPAERFGVGENTVAVEVHQQNAASGDIVFAMALNVDPGQTNPPPVPLRFTEQPQGQIVSIGGTAIFHVSVTGTPPFGYRWRRNGVTVAPFGVGTDTLVISNVQTNDAGSYDCIVTNAANLVPGVRSSSAVLTVIGPANEPPVIVEQPESQTVVTGGTAIFRVGVTGTPPLSYRWRKDGVPIDGATAATLVVSNVQSGNAGVYTALITNPVNPDPGVISAPALLTVIEGTNAVPPVIVRQPLSRTVIVGSSASFHVEATGTPPLGYRWRKDGVDIPGANADTFVFTSAQFSDAGSYTVVVTNPANPAPGVISVPATLTVVAGTNAGPFIVQQPESQTVSIGGMALFRVEASGTPPLGFRWRKDGVAIAGANSGTLVLSNVQPSSAGIYTVLVTNTANPIGVLSAPALLTVIESTNGVPPTITRQPPSGSVLLGVGPTVPVYATGTAPLSYQWYRNGILMPGETNSVLLLEPLTMADNGAAYSVMVSNPFGSVTSENSIIEVIDLPPESTPVITSISPTSGPVGTAVTISGSGFVPTENFNSVRFGGVAAQIQTLGTTQLLVRVPAGASYAPITVTTMGMTAVSRECFDVTFPSVQAIQPSYFGRFDLSASNTPIHMVSADIDGDGRRDLLVLNHQGSTLQIYRHASSDSLIFDPPVSFATGLLPYMVAVGDFDGDWRLDIAVADAGANTVSIFRNLSYQGVIQLGPRKSVAVGSRPMGLAVGDLNRDGFPDIVTGDYDDQTVSVLISLGGVGNFLPRGVFPTGGDPHAVAIGDFNGDQIPDVLAVNYVSSSLALLRGLPYPTNTTTAFLPAILFAGGGNTLAVCDIDNDGRPDVVTGNYARSALYVYRNAGSLTNTFTRFDFGAGTTPHQIGLGDLDGDGRPDICVSGESPSAVSLFRNTTAGPGAISLAPYVQLTAGPNETGIVVADLDADSRPEVVVANAYSNSISIFPNHIPGTQPPSTNALLNVSSPWRYDQSGSNLGSAWRFGGYNDSSWPSGAALLGVEIAPLPAPINTPLALGPITYYFRTTISLTAAQLTPSAQFRANLILDDGAVIYVNGNEALRVGMPGGEITSSTFAMRTVGDAFLEGPFTLPADLFHVGANLIAVEVHQAAVTSSDIVFGMSLDVEPNPRIEAPTITRQPQSLTVEVGGTATFSVEATGTPPLSYQWQKDGALLFGATNRILTLGTVLSSDAGSYSVSVSNPAGSVMSASASLQVVPPTPITWPVITGFSPQSGPTGTMVIITGMNFSTNPVANRVSFGAVRARVIAASNSSLSVEVPVGATYEPISVTVVNRTAYSDRPFIVTFDSSRTIHEGSFGPAVNLPAGDLPIHVSIGDINRDGRPDLVVANTYSGNIAVYRNISTNFLLEPSSFAAPVYFPAGADPYFLALADFDGDGRLDVVTPNINSASITVLRNLSLLTNIVFGPPLTLPAGERPIAVAVGDLDRDGRPDIVVANHDSDTISIFRNRGPGGSTNLFEPRIDIAVGGGPHNLIIGDIDRDGRPDIAVANYETPTMAVLHNLTTGPGLSAASFAPAVQYPRGGNCMAFGDIDGDGKSDIAIANWRTQTLSLFRNTSSSGAIELAVPVDFAMGNNPHTIAFSDLDGDARPDIVLVGELNSYMSIFKNVSFPGSFTLRPRVDFPSGWNAVGVAAGDLDGDSRPDIVFANAYDDNITIYHNLTILGPNSPPVARASVSPALEFLSTDSHFVVLSPTAGGTIITLDGSASSDPDGDSLSFEWSQNGSVFSLDPITSATFALGEYGITLKVSDGKASAATAFTLQVVDPATAVQTLIVLIDQSNLSRRTKRAVISALKTTLDQLERHFGGSQVAAPINLLQLAQRRIEDAVAAENPDLAVLLNSAIQQIINALNAAP